MPSMNPNPPAKPWVVIRRTPARNAYYPWHAEVENHYFNPGDPGFRCFWNTALEDPRFDLSKLEAPVQPVLRMASRP